MAHMNSRGLGLRNLDLDYVGSTQDDWVKVKVPVVEYFGFGQQYL